MAVTTVLDSVGGLLNWWDGVELWLSGLSFGWQAMLVMPVVLMVACVIATGLDGVFGKGIQLIQQVRCRARG